MHDLFLRRKPPPVSVDINHAPDCAGGGDPRFARTCDSWCYIHNQCEPLRPTDYKVCGECFHTFRTEGELIRSHLLVLQAMGMDWPYEGEMDDRGKYPKILTLQPGALRGDDIHCCPHCVHDF